MAFGCVALGGMLYVWQSREPEVPPAPVNEEPVRVKVASRNIVYQLTSDPSAAEVYRGEQLLGKTPLEYRVPEGQSRSLMLKLEEHENANLDLSGDGDSSQTIKVALKSAKREQAWIKIASTPERAMVYHGASQIGVTPFVWEPPASDTPAELTFTKDGYQDHLAKVELTPRGDEAANVAVELVTRPKRTRRYRRRKPKPKPKPGTAEDTTTPKKPKQAYEKL